MDNEYLLKVQTGDEPYPKCTDQDRSAMVTKWFRETCVFMLIRTHQKRYDHTSGIALIYTDPSKPLKTNSWRNDFFTSQFSRTNSRHFKAGKQVTDEHLSTTSEVFAFYTLKYRLINLQTQVEIQTWFSSSDFNLISSLALFSIPIAVSASSPRASTRAARDVFAASIREICKFFTIWKFKVYAKLEQFSRKFTNHMLTGRPETTVNKVPNTPHW